MTQAIVEITNPLYINHAWLHPATSINLLEHIKNNFADNNKKRVEVISEYASHLTQVKAKQGFQAHILSSVMVLTDTSLAGAIFAFACSGTLILVFSSDCMAVPNSTKNSDTCDGSLARVKTT